MFLRVGFFRNIQHAAIILTILILLPVSTCQASIDSVIAPVFEIEALLEASDDSQAASAADAATPVIEAAYLAYISDRINGLNGERAMNQLVERLMLSGLDSWTAAEVLQRANAGEYTLDTVIRQALSELARNSQ